MVDHIPKTKNQFWCQWISFNEKTFTEVFLNLHLAQKVNWGWERIFHGLILYFFYIFFGWINCFFLRFQGYLLGVFRWKWVEKYNFFSILFLNIEFLLNLFISFSLSFLPSTSDWFWIYFYNLFWFAFYKLLRSQTNIWSFSCCLILHLSLFFIYNKKIVLKNNY